MALKIQPQVVQARLKSAQEQVLPLDEICSWSVRRTIKAHAEAIGCPNEFIFYPLLGIAAGCMGVRCKIEINTQWQEPSILWIVVGARKGEKKTPACTSVLKPLFDIQENMRNSTEEGQMKPQLLIDQFSFEELHSVLSNNGGQVMALYDELEGFWQSLDVYKPSGCVMDRKTLLKLYNGCNWDRSFRSIKAFLPRTCFNVSGFIQPQYIVELLNTNDADGFSDRHLILCPPEANYKFHDLKVPVSDDIVPLKRVYEILLSVHGSDKEQCNDLPTATYKFSEEALDVFATQHDVLVQRKQDIQYDDQRRGVLSKAIGQLARLCGVLYALEQAFAVGEENGELDVNEWDFNIDDSTCKKAVMIINYLIDEKFRLMPPELRIDNVIELVANDPKEQFFVDESIKIKKTLEFEGSKKGLPGKIYPCEAVQGRLFTPPKKNGKGENTAANAVPYLEKLSEAGFGQMEEEKKGFRKTKVFCKRKWEDLEAEQMNVIKKLKVNKEKYVLLFEEKK